MVPNICKFPHKPEKPFSDIFMRDFSTKKKLKKIQLKKTSNKNFFSRVLTSESLFHDTKISNKETMKNSFFLSPFQYKL